MYVCVLTVLSCFFPQFSILCFTYLGIPIAFLAPAVQVKSQFLVDLASPFILEKAKAGIQPLLRKALINDILKLLKSLRTVGPVHAFHDFPCMSWGLLLGNRMEPLPRNHCVERKAPAFSTVEWLLLMRPSELSRGEWWVLMEVQWTLVNTNHNIDILHCLFIISLYRIWKNNTIMLYASWCFPSQRYNSGTGLRHCNLVHTPIKANVFGKQQDVFNFLGCMKTDEHVLAVPCEPTTGLWSDNRCQWLLSWSTLYMFQSVLVAILCPRHRPSISPSSVRGILQSWFYPYLFIVFLCFWLGSFFHGQRLAVR